MSELGESEITDLESITQPVWEYSASVCAPLAPGSYTLAEEVYLLLHEHLFAQAFQRLAQGKVRLKACMRIQSFKCDTSRAIPQGLEQEQALAFAGEGNRGADLDIDFDGLRLFLGVSTKLKQPLEWAEVNFVRIFLMYAPNHFFCFEAFGQLAEQYYFFHRQDLSDKLSVAYLDALSRAASGLSEESRF
jgi:hypothetical protein